MNNSWKNNNAIELIMEKQSFAHNTVKSNELVKSHTNCVTTTTTATHHNVNNVNSDNILVASIHTNFTIKEKEISGQINNNGANNQTYSVESFTTSDKQINANSSPSSDDVNTYCNNVVQSIRGSNDTKANRSKLPKADITFYMHKGKRPSLIAMSATPPLYSTVHEVDTQFIVPVDASIVESASIIVKKNLSDLLYLMPFTQEAGVMGKYTIFIFATYKFKLGSIVPLVERERNAMLRLSDKSLWLVNNVCSSTANNNHTVNRNNEELLCSESQLKAMPVTCKLVKQTEHKRSNAELNKQLVHKQKEQLEEEKSSEIFHDREFPNAASSI